MELCIWLSLSLRLRYLVVSSSLRYGGYSGTSGYSSKLEPHHKPLILILALYSSLSRFLGCFGQSSKRLALDFCVGALLIIIALHLTVSPLHTAYSVFSSSLSFTLRVFPPRHSLSYFATLLLYLSTDLKAFRL